MIKTKRIYLILTTFLLSFSIIATASIYKSVDENGNVSYSDSPDPRATEQTTLDMPNHINTLKSDKSQRQYERELSQKAQNDKASLNQQWQKYDRQLKTANTELEKASQQLTDAKILREGDRAFTKTPTGGFSRETQQYKQEHWRDDKPPRGSLDTKQKPRTRVWLQSEPSRCDWSSSNARFPTATERTGRHPLNPRSR